MTMTAEANGEGKKKNIALSFYFLLSIIGSKKSFSFNRSGRPKIIKLQNILYRQC